jgi:hypothetical protein
MNRQTGGRGEKSVVEGGGKRDQVNARIPSMSPTHCFG